MEYYIIEQRDRCKLANRYLISESDPSFKSEETKEWIGEFQEDASSCQAFFLCEFREFRMRCTLLGEDFGTAYRPLKYSISYDRTCFECFCCWNQELVVTKNKIKVGTLRLPPFFGCGVYNRCAGISMQILDGHDQLAYTVESNFCQLGTLCCCLRSCVGRVIEYTIYDVSGKAIGRIVNIHNGCLQELFTKQDKFGLELPGNIAPDHKKLLLNAPIYLDFLRYETLI